MSSADRPGARRQADGPHHFRPSDPADVIERPAPISDAQIQGPRPPRPWYRLVAGQWPVFVTLLVVASGIATSGLSYWRRGATIIGVGVLLGAALRLLLPEKVAGLLCCRSRWIDVTLMTILGAGVIVLAWIVNPTRK